MLTSPSTPKTFPNIDKSLLTNHFWEDDFNEFSADLFDRTQSFYEMFEIFCEIYGEGSISFEARRNRTYFALGLNYGHQTSSTIMSLESFSKYSNVTIGYSFNSYLFEKAAHRVGYPLIEKGEYDIADEFEVITKILKKYKELILFYGKKYDLNNKQQQHFAVWLEIFDRLYTNARPRKEKTIWKSYPKFYQYVATLIKLNFSQAAKIAFIKNSIPADILVSLDGAPDEWLKEILEIAI